MQPFFHVFLDVVSHVSSKNNRPIWSGRLGKSKKLQEAEKYLILKFRQAWQNQEPVSTDVHAKFIFYSDKYYTKTGTKHSRRGDLMNLIQLPADCLQHAGVIVDDVQIESLDGSRVLPAMHNRLEISLYHYVNEPLLTDLTTASQHE